MENSPVRKNSLRAWVLASRPKTLSAAVFPVAVAIAFSLFYGKCEPVPALLALVFAVLMQIDANLVNDLFDFYKGADGKGRKGPKRACAEGWVDVRSMKLAISAVTVTAAATGSCLLFYGGLWLLAVGAACLLFAFLYTAGPYPLAYHGWGDALVFVFFGFVPVCCTFYVVSGDFSYMTLYLGAACGFVVDCLLLVNNIRDIDQDRENGKITLVVRLGKELSEHLFLAFGVLAVVMLLPFVHSGAPAVFWLALLYLPLHWRNCRRLKTASTVSDYGKLLAGASAGIVLFGLLVCAGFAIHLENI